MRTVAIVGVGLIGASFGLALRKSGFAGPILGVSSEPAIEAALSAGAISGSATLKEASGCADLIYLAQPVDRILETIRLLAALFSGQPSREILITDAGSTKTAIVQAAVLHLRHVRFDVRFIGGHPMAGKETRGAQSADADLFRNRPYVLTSDLEQVPQDFRSLLHSIGANVLTMTPEEHDATVALTSHLPQLISTALAGFLGKQTQPQIQQVFGSGLLDMTRLALSPVDLWASILATNKGNVSRALDLYANELLNLRKLIDKDDLGEVFLEAAAFSRTLRKLDN
jgi:prephenate dehydrogenase